MTDFEKFFKEMPPFTKIFLGSVVLTSFLITYPIIEIIPYILLDYSKAVFSLQIWRLLTNFVVVGKFSFNFIFFLLLFYQQIYALETKAILNKKYGDFIMMILYIMSILLLINLLLQYKVYLSMELLFAFIYIDSKRDPDKMVSLWGFVMKSRSYS